MSKKNKKKNKSKVQNAVSAKKIEENVEVIEPDVVDKKETENVSVKDNAKQENLDKKNKKPVKDKKDKKSIGKRIRETISELKKVSWPTFSKTVKSTGVVILVVLICAVLLLGLDVLFQMVYSLIMTGKVSLKF